MEPAEVVVRRPLNDNEPVRVGAVLYRVEKRPVKFRVRWEDDGQEEDVRLDSHTVFAVRGSLQHCWLVAPSSLPGMLAADPSAIILRLLCENNRAMTAVDVKKQLVRLGLDEKAVAKAWTAAQKGFAKNDHVRVEGRTYRWVEPAAEFPGDIDQQTTGATTPADESDQPDVGSSAAPDKKPSGLAAAVAKAVGDGSDRSIEHYLKNPLRTGQRLGRLSESALDNLLAPLTPRDRAQALTLLLALPGPTDALDAPERLALLDPAVAEAVLVSAADEIRNGARPSPADRTAAGWLVRRAATIGAPGPAAVASLIELCSHIAGDARDSDLEALDVAAALVARVLAQLPPDAGRAIELDRLAGAVARLPLTAKGGRVALLAAVGTARPKSLLDEIWWRGATLRALADCATGILGGVTSLPPVAEQVVQPLARKELSVTTSRTQLGFLLGLPREFTAQLPADGVAAAFRRAAGRDPVVARWVEALTDGERAEALHRDLERARAEMAAATERAEAAERRTQELVERCDRLEEILRRDHTDAVALRASQERQIRIDVVRALAELAAEIEELAINRIGPDVLVERVRGLVATQALEPIAMAGADVHFDPTRHEPIVDAPVTGATVSVIRPGYWWHTPGEDILIHKALVSPT